MRLYISLAILTFFLLQINPAAAQDHKGYCDKADSTATSQQCLKKHLDSAQERLNKIYNRLSAQLSGDKLSALKNIQKEWLTYRDSECMWEAEQIGDPALKRINELSCMARVTEDRIDLLTLAYAEVSESQDTETPHTAREHGSFPRWMNVLATDYSDIYWNYGDRQSVDLNCDSEPEFIMQGIKTALQDMPVSEDNDAEVEAVRVFTKDVILAIVENPTTGRPKPTTFEYLVSPDGEQSSICSQNLKLKILERPEAKDVQESETQNTCRTYLEVASKGCDPKIIKWADKKFMTEIKETETKTE